MDSLILVLLILIFFFIATAYFVSNNRDERIEYKIKALEKKIKELGDIVEGISPGGKLIPEGNVSFWKRVSHCIKRLFF